MYSFINLLVMLLALLLGGLSNFFLVISFLLESAGDKLYYWSENRGITKNWRM